MNVTGVVITKVDPNSDAAEKGFRPGDVIVQVGNKNVRAPADIEPGVTEASAAARACCCWSPGRQAAFCRAEDAAKLGS